MRVFLTGATGFVGSVLVPKLLKMPSLDRLKILKLAGEPVPESWNHDRVQVIESDLLNRKQLIEGMTGATHVIHLAGLISYRQADAKKLEAVNVGGVENIIAACLQHRIRRLVHISSVGGIGFHPDGRAADEEVPFNWPRHFHYMTTKYRGQQVVREAMEKNGLDAVILNPASIMGPGDPNPATPHNQLYHRLFKGRMIGSFSGGLAVVDVRDLVAIILKSLTKKSFAHDRYLVVGHNIRYPDLLRMMGEIAGKKVYPFRVPAWLITLAGGLSERVCRLLGTRPLLTYSYGKISGMTGFYDHQRSIREFHHRYLPMKTTIQDSCEYYRSRFLS